MRVLGCIIAGGVSSRMGQEKALMLLGGKPLIVHVAARLACQVEQLSVNANGDAARFEFLNLPVFHDLIATGGTPLAGLHASLQYAKMRNFDAVLSVPSDTPFLPFDLRTRLEIPSPSIAASQGQEHYLTGFWPVSLLSVLERASAARNLTRVRDWAALVAAKRVEWVAAELDPFFNVNTPEDLTQAETYLVLSEKL